MLSKTRFGYVKKIKNRKRFTRDDIVELWNYRELFWFFALRDILVRYKQTAIGISWAVLQPFFTMVILSIIFGSFAKLPSEGVPYPIMVFTALLPWQLFSNSVSSASRSIVGNAPIITKIYFPRLVIPASAIILGCMDFLISLIILIGMMAWYRITPTLHIIYLPFFVVFTLIAAFSISLWLSALYVEFRDVIYIIPFLLQVGQYLSPVAYSSSLIPKKWSMLYSLNPLAGIIDGFRWCILNTKSPNWSGIIFSMFIVLVIFIGGLFYFKKTERTFADII
jgi:lipopolysaccharide transport system permease protein